MRNENYIIYNFELKDHNILKYFISRLNCLKIV